MDSSSTWGRITAIMKILLIGKRGQIGHELEKRLPKIGELTALGRDELDLRDVEWIRATVRTIEPDLIVNTAAYTDVDRAEEEPEFALALNRTAPRVLAQEAEHLGAGLVHYSTDYLFDGEKGEPYLEDDEPRPLNFYGISKLEGEAAIIETGANALILRTSWVYGLRRENFVTKVFRWASENAELKIVADQVSRPTWSVRIALATIQILEELIEAGGFPSNVDGIYHMASRGSASRYTWAQAILHHVPPDKAPKLVAATSDEFPSPAARPRYSALDTSRLDKTFGVHLPDWREDLSLALTARRLPKSEAVAREIA